jgi:polar amino acid transport system permease protein
MAIALVLGLVIALARRTRVRPVGIAVTFAADFIRGTPLLIQLYVIFYVFPTWGLTLSPLMSGVLGLGIHYSTYTAEVYRAGVEGVPRGQWEAARALNFSRARTWWHVVLPQAIPPVIPVLGNHLIGMFKETPLLSAIAVIELVGEARIIGSETFRYLEPMTLVGLLFLLVSLLSAVVVVRLERRFGAQLQSTGT